MKTSVDLRPLYLKVWCSRCGAFPDDPCRTEHLRDVTGAHRARRQPVDVAYRLGLGVKEHLAPLDQPIEVWP